MRLDKYISDAVMLSRSDSQKAIRQGRVSLNGVIVRSPSEHVKDGDSVSFDGEAISRRENIYIMLNKPIGTVCTTDIADGRCVLRLLPEEFSRRELFPCGRLDIDTVGLLLITDDGELAHELLSPKKHAAKSYRFKCGEALSDSAIAKLECGVDIGEDRLTLPCAVVPDSDRLGGVITVTEGKFHQIKRMLEAVGTFVSSLERVTFGSLSLDPNLSRGQWRYLDCGETAELLKYKRK